MVTLHLTPDLPQVTPLQRLAGCHLELCIELLGNSEARIFVRAVDRESYKATELQHGILFLRLDTRFNDLPGCVEAIRADLEPLVDTARRHRPSRDNLFTAVEYDRLAWDRVQTGVDRWSRRPVVRAGAAPTRFSAGPSPQQALRAAD